MFSEFLWVSQHVLECNKCRRDGWMLTWFLKFSSENGFRIPHGPYRCVDSKITIKPSCVIVDERCLLVNRFWPMFLALYRVSAASWSKRCSAALICIIMMSISTLWIRTNVNRKRVESRRRITLSMECRLCFTWIDDQSKPRFLSSPLNMLSPLRNFLPFISLDITGFL